MVLAEKKMEHGSIGKSVLLLTGKMLWKSWI